jgi:hypothetical protein
MSGETARPGFETEIATYAWDGGILISHSKPPRRTVENIRANLEAVGAQAGGQLPCIVVHLTKSPMPDKATREYVNARLPTAYRAMAMVSPSGLARFIMNFLFGVKPPPIPMKSFADEASAKEWIRRYL